MKKNAIMTRCLQKFIWKWRGKKILLEQKRFVAMISEWKIHAEQIRAKKEKFDKRRAAIEKKKKEKEDRVEFLLARAFAKKVKKEGERSKSLNTSQNISQSKIKPKSRGKSETKKV